MESSFENACMLLKNIETVEGEEKDKVTKSFLRKVFELLDESESKEEYLISVGYMVARKEAKRGSDVVVFFERLRDIVKGMQKDWNDARKELKKLLEYTIKLYYIKAEMGEDLCTKL